MQKVKNLLTIVSILLLLLISSCSESTTRTDNSEPSAEDDSVQISDYSGQKDVVLPKLRENCNQYLTIEEIKNTCGVMTDSVESYGYVEERFGQRVRICIFETGAESKGPRKSFSFGIGEYNKNTKKGRLGSSGVEAINYKGIKLFADSNEPSELQKYYVRFVRIDKENYYWAVSSLDICTLDQVKDLAVLIHNRAES